MKSCVTIFFLTWLATTGFSAPTPAFASPDPAPGVTGFWITGKNQAVTQIYSCGGNLLCGELVGFPMDHASDAMPQTWAHQPQCHFVFIRYLHPRDDGSWRGNIINPQSGNSFGAAVRQTAPDQLSLRGFLLFNALGSTRVWTRYTGPTPPQDCRMPPHSLN